jgi:leucine dehydrogenase
MATATKRAAPAAPEARVDQRVIECRDRTVGLRGVIVIDDTTLGPGLGGVRFKPYPTLADGERECRRLAAAMTLKNAVAELPFGGAKAVVLSGGTIPDRAALMRRFGEFVAACRGDYLPGVDMGTSTTDLAEMGEAGATVSCSHEDPSPWTAAGVEAAVRAAIGHVQGHDDLRGVRVLVQGAGHVGASLATELAADGASVLIADVDSARAEALARTIGARTIDPEDVIGTPCDVFAPCAVAGVVNQETAVRLDCQVVAGAANDTLSSPADAQALAERGITYVPDFVANAGGVVHIHAVRAGWDEPRLRREVLRIGDRVRHVLEQADDRGCTPLEVAEHMAALRLADARVGAQA